MNTSVKTRPVERRSAAAGRKTGVREQSAQVTQDSILRAATRIFAKHGFAGGRVDQISKAAKSHDRMIYYYFGSKEGLYIAVLEDLYRRFNEAEAALKIDAEEPEQALSALVGFIWNYYQRHPEFITLLNDENLHRGKHIAKSLRAHDYSSPATELLQKVLARGVEKNLFKPDIEARDLYLMIASLTYFYLSNRYTLSAFFGHKLDSAQALADWHHFVTQSVLSTVRR